MNRLDSVLSNRVKRGFVPATRKVLVLSVVLALVLLAVALTMTALPTTTADAAADQEYVCKPESASGDKDKEPQPKIARPRATVAGKDLNGGELVPGDEILWTVTVKNLGDKLTKILITDIVPEWTTYVGGSIDGSGANDGGNPTLTWSVASLGCGERVTVSFRSRVNDDVPEGTLIINWASADSAQTPPGVSDAVVLKVAGSSAKSTDSSTPTAVAGQEVAASEDTSEGTTGAASGSTETTSAGTSSGDDPVEESKDDESDPKAGVTNDDEDDWKLGVGLGAGLGGLALIGVGAGLERWRSKRKS